MSQPSTNMFSQELRSHFSDDSSSLGPPSSPIQVALAVRAQMATPAVVQLEGTSNQAPPAEHKRVATPSDLSWRTATPPPAYELQPESSPTSPFSPVNRKGDSGNGLELALAAADAALVKRGYQPYPKPTPKPHKLTTAANVHESAEETNDVGPHRSRRRGPTGKVVKARKWADKVSNTTPDANKAYDQALKSIKADLAEAKKAIDRTTAGPSKAPRRSVKVSKPIIPLSCLSILSRRKTKSKPTAA